MEQIIKALSVKLNLPESVVRSGVGILLNFVKQKAAGTQFEQLIASLPGADGLMETAPTEANPTGGLLSGLLGKAGGLLGGMGGAAEAVGALQQAGIPLEKAVPLAAEFFEEAKKVAGPDTVETVLAQIPALRALLGASHD